MTKQFLQRFVGLIVALLVGRSVAVAQTAAGDVLRGQGAYLKGLGWYNLKTAEANAINADTTIRWKADLRKIQRERWDRDAELAAGKKARKEEVLQQLLERERQLRLDPSSADVEKGDALNVLVYDLTDPDIKSTDWSSKTVPLPPGTSVKDLIFRFTPQNKQGAGATALSKGVIALSRLDIEGKWPTVMKVDALNRERAAYEKAYAKVRDHILTSKNGDNFDLKLLFAMDESLENLKKKAMTSVPKERNFRDQALKFVEDLKASTRFFDAETVDYAREILNDTQDRDATTVAELVSFMLKYRLQFATAERSPTAKELYPQLYHALRQQTNELGIKPPETVPVDNSKRPVGGQLTNGNFRDGWNGWKIEGDTDDFIKIADGITTFGKKKESFAKGRLQQSFQIPEDATELRFDIHGGRNDKLFVALRDQENVYYKATGNNTNKPSLVIWNVKKLSGKKVTLEIVDQSGGPWQHLGVQRLEFVLSPR